MSPIKIALATFSLAACCSLSTANADEILQPDQNVPIAGDEAESDLPATADGRSDAGRRDGRPSGAGTSIADAADEDRTSSLLDSFFMMFGGMTWEGLAAQARWSEAYITGKVARYDRERYDQCLEFLADYYLFLELTALIDVELEVYLDDIGVLADEADGRPTNAQVAAPDGADLDTDTTDIPNSDA